MLTKPEMGIPLFGALAGLLLAIIGTAMTGDEDVNGDLLRHQANTTVGIQATLLILIGLMAGAGKYIAFAGAVALTEVTLSTYFSAAVLNDEFKVRDDKYTTGYLLICIGVVVSWLAQFPFSKIGEAISNIFKVPNVAGVLAAVASLVASFMFYSVYDDNKATQSDQIENGVSAMIFACLLLVVVLLDVKPVAWIVVVFAGLSQEDLFSLVLNDSNDDTLRAAGFFAFVACWIGILCVIFMQEGEMVSITQSLIPAAGAVVGFVLALVGVIIAKKGYETSGNDDVDNWAKTNVCWGPLFLLVGYLFSDRRRNGFSLLAFVLSSFPFSAAIGNAAQEDFNTSKDDDIYTGNVLIAVGLLLAFVSAFFLYLSEIPKLAPAGLNKLVTYAGVGLLLVSSFILFDFAGKDINKAAFGSAVVAFGMLFFVLALYAIVVVIMTSPEAGLLGAGYLSMALSFFAFNFFDTFNSLGGSGFKSLDSGKAGWILGWIGCVLTLFGSIMTGQQEETSA